MTALMEDEKPEDAATDADKQTRSRMPDDMKTMAAILRLLEEHDSATAADIMEYVYRRAKRNQGVS